MKNIAALAYNCNVMYIVFSKLYFLMNIAM